VTREEQVAEINARWDATGTLHSEIMRVIEVADLDWGQTVATLAYVAAQFIAANTDANERRRMAGTLAIGLIEAGCAGELPWPAPQTRETVQ